MTLYVDASVLVANVLNEPQSELVRNWLKQSTERILIGEFAALEVAAVISRAVRTQRFDGAQAATAQANFDILRQSCASLGHSRADYSLAEHLVRDFSTKLAAPDALHLATSINAGATLATFDMRLLEAARARGEKVIVPA